MDDAFSKHKDVREMKARLDHLEEVSRFSLEAMEMAASVGDFQSSINRMDEPSMILNETRLRVERLIPFHCTAFFLVEESSSDFVFADCVPPDRREWLQREVEYLVEDGSFARALRTNRPVFVFSRDYDRQILLHVMATVSRVRGMFLGIPAVDFKHIRDVSLSLLSIVMLNSANALESFELYKRIREFNKSLEHKVSMLTASEEELLLHRARLEQIVRERTAQLEETVSRLNAEVAERKRAEVRLKESRELLRNIFLAIPDLLTVQDREFRILMSNCLEVERLQSPTLSESDTWDSEPRCYEIYARRSAPCEPCPVRRVFETGRMEQAEVADLFGGAVNEVRAFPVFDSSGKVSMVAEHVRNITEHKRMEEELFKSQKLESVGLLAGGIAHDFNNLLTAVLGSISLAVVDGSCGGRLLERLKATEKACLRARDLTRQLLTFSKGGDPIRRIARVGQLVRDTAEFALRGTNVKCEFQIRPDLWSAEIDEGQINQVISNLVINAYQAMPAGGVVAIAVENAPLPGDGSVPLPKGDYVRISVSDNGPGIPEEHLSKIFDPYFTTKQDGTGLGLATSYSIIRKHGGYIGVRSRTGEGAAFTFYLPAVRRMPPMPDMDGSFHFTHRGKVLLMDDDELVRFIAGEMLAHLGYDVEFAEDGSRAIAVYLRALGSDDPFDAVIMDLTIPGGMGGKETLEKLLEIDPRVKAVASSGYSDELAMADFRKYGYKGIICKPYRIQDLEKVLREVVGP